ncbi:unnamed protein product [Paramecium sonneborni]|uniref:Uncharacterized protein n=1 Tax=Paramecium sonneborni TaxID=65129 RepID=A0A8S1RQE6_9CILI|nr:unnamed protein product [Paramecium sonneborni]
MSNKKQTLQNKQQQKRLRQINQNTNIAQIQIVDQESDESQFSQSKNLNENNAENFLDSLQQQDDHSDQSKQQQKKSSNNNFKKLLKKNEKLYCNTRGVHYQVEIATLTRLGNSSYVYFDEKQRFNTEFQDVLNRFYKSIPIDKEKKVEKVQSQFHDNLLDFEDNRLLIDSQMLSLRKQLRLKKQNKTIDQDMDIIQSIENQIDQLKQKKRELGVQQEEEKKCFYLSIDQKYHLKQQEHLKCLTPRYFQIQSQLIYDLILKNENPSFQIYPYKKQPQWLSQYKEKFNIFKQKDKQIWPPLYFYSFQDKSALMITSHLILISIRLLNHIQDNQVYEKIFIDLIKVLFNIDIPESDHLFNTENLNEEIIKILISQEKQNIIDQNEICDKTFQTPEYPEKNKKKLKFYPNFQKEELVIYGRPVFECSLRIMYEIYLRVQKIMKIQTTISYQNNKYMIGNLILECCYQQLIEQMTNITWQTICKSILNEKDSCEISSLNKLINDFLILYYQYDKFTFELLKNKIYNVLGKNSKMVKEKVDIIKISANQLLQKFKEELKNRMMARIQTVNGLMVIHVFELN